MVSEAVIDGGRWVSRMVMEEEEEEVVRRL